MTTIGAMDLAHECARGNAALWVTATTPRTLCRAADGSEVCDWIAAWVELRMGERADSTGEWLGRRAPELRERVVLTDDYSSRLGTSRPFRSFQPVLALPHRVAGSSPWTPEGRTWYEALGYLGSLRGAFVLCLGVPGDAALLESLRDATPSSQLVVVPSRAEPAWDAPTGVLVSELPLEELLGFVAEVQTSPRSSTQLRIGETSVELGDLVSTLDPVDQHFRPITSDMVTVSGSPTDEEYADGIASLQGGNPPWSALRLSITWPRPTVQRAWREFRKALSQAARGRGTLFALGGETGSGLTTALATLAHKAAAAGYPVLFHRSPGELSQESALASLQGFMDAIEERVEATKPWVLVFDRLSLTPAGSADVLRRVGRVVSSSRSGGVVLLGREIRAHGDSASPAAKSLKAAVAQALGSAPRQRGRPEDQPFRTVLALQGEALAAYLDPDRELGGLHAWLGRMRKLSPALETRLGLLPRLEDLAGWNTAYSELRVGVPLLVALWYAFKGDLGAPQEFPRRMFEHATRLPMTDDARAPDRPEEIPEFLRSRLLRMWEPTPEQFELTRVLMILCMASRLQTPIPAGVVALLAGIGTGRVQASLRHLRRKGLLLEGVPITPGLGSQTILPSTFYGEDGCLLSHPAIALALLAWTAGPGREQVLGLAKAEPGEPFWILLGQAPGADDVLATDLLSAVFESLALSTSDAVMDYMEELGRRHIRLQRRARSDFESAQWDNRDRLVAAAGRISDRHLQQSSSLLLSRAILEYKSTWQKGVSAAAAEALYRRAEADHAAALEVSAAESGRRQEDAAIILTSLGQQYLGWSDALREANDEAWRARADSARRALEDGLRLRLESGSDNLHARFSLARYHIGRCLCMQKGEIPFSEPEYAASLEAAARYLLDATPPSYFLEEWEDASRDLYELVSDATARQIVASLKQSRQCLGFALEALIELNGDMPLPHEYGLGHELDRSVQRAWSCLSEQRPDWGRSPLYDLLRYSVFSALPERAERPELEERLRILRVALESNPSADPTFAYDAAYLAWQTKEYDAADETFSHLRFAQRFRRVPPWRQLTWSRNGRVVRAQVSIRAIGSARGVGFGVVVLPERIERPDVSLVRTDWPGRDLRPGDTLVCGILLRSTGPRAIPL